MTPTAHRSLILASTSLYRRQLLQRLRIPFEVVAPDVDESALPGETPEQLAKRLSAAKADAVASLHPQCFVIGSDQVADLHGDPLGKPHTHERAVVQLQRMRGQKVIFHTAVTVSCRATGFTQTELASVGVTFRHLSDEQIHNYLNIEQPYDCAGSAKSEGLGIALLERIDNDDPTALIGLPLIRTCALLRAAGLSLF